MTAWRWLAAMVFWATLGVGSVQAQDSALQRLDTWGRGHGWEGVGLLSLDGRATCTGVLIQPDLVLTAAHCVLDARTGQPIEARLIEFRAGLRDARAVARRVGRVALVHPGFALGSRATGDQVRNDVALIRLDSPIPATHATPFAAPGGLRTGDRVSVVSYGVGRNDAPSRQGQCEVLQVRRGLAALSCAVVPGSSGAPVFEMRDGRPVVVALISSAGMVDRRQIAYGMDIAAPLAGLLREFRAGGRGAKRIGPTSAHSAGGARFLKP